MKRSIRIALISCFVFLLAAAPVAATTSVRNKTVTLPAGETVQQDYFAAGDVVMLSGVVNGDAYIAGGIVTVNGTVNGDLFVAGGTVTINGTLAQDLRAAGGTVIVTSPVPGSVTVAGGTVTFTETAPVTGSILAGAGTLNIASTIGGGITAGAGTMTIGEDVDGNIVAGAGSLTIMPGVHVAGDLTYWSDTPAETGEGATVSGMIKRHDAPESDLKKTVPGMQDMEERFATSIAGAFIAWKIAGFLLTFVLGLLLFRFMPNFTKKVTESFNAMPLKSAGIGFLTLIGIPVAALALMITLVGIPAGAFLFAALAVLLYVAHMYAGLSLGIVVLRWLNVRTSQSLIFLTGLALLFFIMLVPFFGFLAKSVIELIALGAVMTEKIAVAKTMREKRLI